MSYKNIGCIVQARMGSSRFPGKVLKDLNGAPVIKRVFDQLSYANKLTNVILATSTNEEDNILVDWAKNENVSFYRGSPLDVLDRYYNTANYFSTEIIVRITADCPLVDPELVDAMIQYFIANKYDYICNNNPLIHPQGYEVEVFSFKSLEKAWKESKLLSEREHVTPYIWKNPNLFKIGSFIDERINSNYEKYRLTLDYEVDLIVLNELFSKLAKSKYIGLLDTINFIDNNELVFTRNQNIPKNEGYLKSLMLDNKNK